MPRCTPLAASHTYSAFIVRLHVSYPIGAYVSKFTAASRGSPCDSTAVLLTERTARSMIGYWHDSVICLSVCDVPYISIETIDLHFAADSVGLSSFTFLVDSVNPFCKSAYRPFKVIQSH